MSIAGEKRLEPVVRIQHQFADSHAPAHIRRGITLLEVLVVIGIIGLLLGVLVPGLNHSRRMAKQTACLAGLQQIGLGICAYAMENKGHIPYGQQPITGNARSFYTINGQTTSIISNLNGKHVGLGLLLKSHLLNSAESLFCPGADVKWDTKESLALVGKEQVESSYYYRHGSISQISPVGGVSPPRTQLDRLGDNRKGNPIRTLAMDTQFIASGQMAMFNIHTRTHHQQRVVNALYTDAHASTHLNTDDRFQIQVGSLGYQTISKILSVFEELDTEP